MKYPLFKVQINSKQALKNIEGVFASGFINEGEQVLELEKGLSRTLGVKNLTLVNSFFKFGKFIKIYTKFI
jgi:dTDP-4-amino-4,6-dideoxygalactose transaminase